MHKSSWTKIYAGTTDAKLNHKNRNPCNYKRIYRAFFLIIPLKESSSAPNSRNNRNNNK